jgi:Carbohydrate-binding module family 5/12
LSSLSLSAASVGSLALNSNWKGSWASGTAYQTNDAVLNNGSSYVCHVAHTSAAGNEPGVGASWQTYWYLIARGATSLAVSTVQAGSGIIGSGASPVTIILAPGDGAAQFGDLGGDGVTQFRVTLMPPAGVPSKTTAEIAIVTRFGDTLTTVLRGQELTSTHVDVAAGWIVEATLTAGVLKGLLWGYFPGPIDASRPSNGGVVADDNFDTTAPNPAATDNYDALVTAFNIANLTSAERKGCELILPSGAIKLGPHLPTFPDAGGTVTGVLPFLGDGVQILGQGIGNTQLNIYQDNPGVDTTCYYLSWDGPLSAAAANLAVDVAERDDTATLVAGSVAALGLAVGDWVFFSDTTHTVGGGSVANRHLSMIVEIAGEVLTLADPFWRPMVTVGGVPPIVNKTSPLTGVGAHDFTVDGYQAMVWSPSNQPAEYATFGSKAHLKQIMLIIRGSIDYDVDRMKFQWCGSGLVDYDVATGGESALGQSNAALYTSRSRGRLHDVRTFACGSRSIAAVTLGNNTGDTLSDLDIRSSIGFGLNVAGGGNCHGSNIRVIEAGYLGKAGQLDASNHYGTGRCMKLQSHSYANLSNITVARSWDTGFGLTIQSRHNKVTGLNAVRCGWGLLQSVGVWLDGSDNSYNQVRGASILSTYTGSFSTGPITMGNSVTAGTGDDVGNYIEGEWDGTPIDVNVTAPFNRLVVI